VEEGGGLRAEGGEQREERGGWRVEEGGGWRVEGGGQREERGGWRDKSGAKGSNLPFYKQLKYFCNFRRYPIFSNKAIICC
jgi:hypothetical protein